ncbi:hypothetical protein FB45DRAFT_1116403 [Roridomyces roridus]|uniref:F-box domain-containing protein n=1 Tax=Roridomyces roridus TaxID=1738132 RepID=A0AAD7FXN9_9AGAR|nr:hypothetical protein FB45DRAFT_1116403 [Roridomyces roridus]
MRPQAGLMKNHLVQAVDRARHGFKRTRSGSVSRTPLVLIPPELWISIFSYLSSPADIRAATLTCQNFRQCAQPLLFAKIFTHPAPPSLALRGLQPNKYRRRTSQRLEFFLSPLIAPAVRECWIDPPSPEDEDVPTDVLIDAIFAGLEKFPNLRVLGCRSIRLTLMRLAVLQRLSLSTITLDSCQSDLVDCPDSPPTPATPLNSVTFKYSDPQEESLRPLLSFFLSPRHLQRLTATTTRVLSAIARSSRPFSRLHQLELSVDCLLSDTLVPALSRCPALERITILPNPDSALPRSRTLPALPASLLPNLKLYRGPRNYAAHFARATRQLQTVEVSIPTKVHRLIRTLTQVPGDTLDYLSFRLDEPAPTSLLTSVHRLCPALRTLSMNDPPVAHSHLHALLSQSAPHLSLRAFRVRVEGRDRYNLWVPPTEEAADAIECFRRVHAELKRVYPNLFTLKIMYGVEGQSVVWRRSGGELVQMTQVAQASV